MMEQTNWHSKSVTACMDQLHTTVEGLSLIEAQQRLAKYGSNELKSAKKASVLRKWLNQFHNVLIYILLVAAIFTAMLQHWLDTSIIIAVVLLNAIIGYFQEAKAESSIAALKKMLSLKATVIRDSKHYQIDAKELIPGDIILLRMGDKVPADARLITTKNLQIDEAIVTGESLPVDKAPTPCENIIPVSDRSSMAYSGTFVNYGTASAVVVATGQNTEVGRISKLLETSSEFSTPLLRQLSLFGRWLAAIIVSFSALLFIFGLVARNYPIQELILAVVALAVAVIPEGLPAIITIILAVGVTRMAKRNAIIRRLTSVETLSSVTVICTDKTGTLTKNELTVQTVITSNNQYELSGSGYNDEGSLIHNDAVYHTQDDADLSQLIHAGVLCNEAELRKADTETWELSGNPMDGALLALGLKAQLDYQQLRQQYSQIDVIPFDSDNKFMASLHQYQNKSYIFVKGAPEKIVSMCSYQRHNQKNVAIDRDYWQTKINHLAKNGKRVLAIAVREISTDQNNLTLDDVKSHLSFLGIVGIIDPPREEVRDAILACQQAGIRIKMVTGDHRYTAEAIAEQVGISTSQILTGDIIDTLSDDELLEIVDDIDIYARTIPEHKIRLIKALQKRQHIVAMTGDGVNDAPALQNADVGIAMGIKGTDVAKEVSEFVLADDNFSSIEHAVEEGRNVYTNLKKTILFILPNGGGEGLSILVAILLGYTLPITPAQILWVNMITAVTLALALAFEPPEKNLMALKPRNPNEPLLSRFLLWRIGFVSFLFVCSMFGLFVYETHQGTDIALARTMVVNVLVLLEAGYLINCRSIYDSVLNKQGILGSKPIVIAISLVILLQLGFTYLPFMQYFFKTQALNLTQWIIICSIVLLGFFIVEGEKAVIRYFKSAV